jgi:hypothetical protein
MKDTHGRNSFENGGGRQVTLAYYAVDPLSGTSETAHRIASSRLRLFFIGTRFVQAWSQRYFVSIASSWPFSAIVILPPGRFFAWFILSSVTGGILSAEKMASTDLELLPITWPE